MELETHVLPEDLLSDILPHLPLKSLGQCKVLSRQWNAEISRRRLIATHLERHPEPTSTLLLPSGLTIIQLHSGSESKCLSRDHPTNNLGVVVGTHRGLICFSDYETGKARVWNPVLDLWRTFDFQRTWYKYAKNFFGFGYDTVENDYKVVRISESRRGMIIQICGFRTTRNLVVLRRPGQVQFMLSNSTPVTVDGSSHWIAFHPKNEKLQIVRFDMDHKKFVEIPFSNDMPNISYDLSVRGIEALSPGEQALQGLDMDGKRFRLGVFKGSLCLFITDSLKVDIWLMDQDNGHVAWTRIFEIPISCKIVDVVGFTANEELVVRSEKDGYFAYDPWKERYVFPLEHCGLIHQAVAYVESTVPLLR